jgi:hypothetical protein
MCNILAQTFASAEAFWTAVAGTSALLALIFLVLEVPKLRAEIALHKVEGFKYASEQLLADDFRAWLEAVTNRWKQGGDDFPQDVYGEVTALLGRLDFIAKLVEVGFVDKSLLLYVFHDDLTSLEAVVRNVESRNNSKIPGIRASYPAGYSLLKEGASQARAFSRKAFARLRKLSP